ncbi:MAG: hypothetical protein R2795_02635 [Saprospiraceae bacterium]
MSLANKLAKNIFIACQSMCKMTVNKDKMARVCEPERAENPTRLLISEGVFAIRLPFSKLSVLGYEQNKTPKGSTAPHNATKWLDSIFLPPKNFNFYKNR